MDDGISVELVGAQTVLRLPPRPPTVHRGWCVLAMIAGLGLCLFAFGWLTAVIVVTTQAPWPAAPFGAVFVVIGWWLLERGLPLLLGGATLLFGGLRSAVIIDADRIVVRETWGWLRWSWRLRRDRIVGLGVMPEPAPLSAAFGTDIVLVPLPALLVETMDGRLTPCAHDQPPAILRALAQRLHAAGVAAPAVPPPGARRTEDAAGTVLELAPLGFWCTPGGLGRLALIVLAVMSVPLISMAFESPPPETERVLRGDGHVVVLGLALLFWLPAVWLLLVALHWGTLRVTATLGAETLTVTEQSLLRRRTRQWPRTVVRSAAVVGTQLPVGGRQMPVLGIGLTTDA